MSVFGVILVRIFPAFSGIWTEYVELRSISLYSVLMQKNAGKMPTRITPNTDTFYAVSASALTFRGIFKNLPKIYVANFLRKKFHLICTQSFPKTNIFYPLIRTRTCPYQGIRNVSFSENFA